MFASAFVKQTQCIVRKTGQYLQFYLNLSPFGTLCIFIYSLESVLLLRLFEIKLNTRLYFISDTYLYIYTINVNHLSIVSAATTKICSNNFQLLMLNTLKFRVNISLVIRKNRKHNTKSLQNSSFLHFLVVVF